MLFKDVFRSLTKGKKQTKDLHNGLIAPRNFRDLCLTLIKSQIFYFEFLQLKALVVKTRRLLWCFDSPTCEYMEL